MRHGPLHFGRSARHRFDSPDGSYGVLYAGQDPYCASVESIARIPTVPVVTTSELKQRALSELRAARPLRLVDLARSGAYDVSRRWSQALHAHSEKADGLLCPSRLDPARHGIALFEDRAPKLRELMRQSWYATGSQRARLVEIVEHYRIELIENHVVVSRKPATSARQDDLF
jgi:hypothetical protein